MITTNDLQLIRGVVREEVEIGSKSTQIAVLKLETKIGKVESRLGKVESKLKGVDSRLSNHGGMLDSLDLKIETFHEDIEKKIDVLRIDILDTFDEVLGSIDELNSTMDKRVSRVEKHCGAA